MANRSKIKSNNKVAIPLLALIGFAGVVATPSMIIVACGMIPSVIATFINPSRVRGSIAAMIALNLAGVIPVVGILWQRGHSIDQALDMLTDVYMWLIMFGGAGVATFLLWGLPIVVQAFYEVQARQVIKRLERRRSKLIEEWGGQIIDDAKLQSTAFRSAKK